MNERAAEEAVKDMPSPRATGARPVPAGLQPSLLVTASSLLRVLVVGMFLLTFVAQPYRIPSGSMIPTLLVGDFVLVSKCAFGPRAAGHGLWAGIARRVLPPADVGRNALVVFHFPPNPQRDLVKRVVALPGEHLFLHDGRVYVNGEALKEPFALYTAAGPELFRDEFPNMREADPNIDPHWWMSLRHHLDAEGQLVVPSGEYFVMGDNRNNSEDSRYWGFVPQAMIVGEPILIYFAVPNGADAPAGGILPRLRWLGEWVGQRAGVPK